MEGAEPFRPCASWWTVRKLTGRARRPGARAAGPRQGWRRLLDGAQQTIHRDPLRAHQLVSASILWLAVDDLFEILMVTSSSFWLPPWLLLKLC